MDYLNSEQMNKVAFHPDWLDGRKGFVWCRFDGVVDAASKLRAELTWADDYHHHPYIDDRNLIRYFRPELLLEVNIAGADGWVRVAEHVIELTNEEALAILKHPPASLLDFYPEEWQRIR